MIPRNEIRVLMALTVANGATAASLTAALPLTENAVRNCLSRLKERNLIIASGKPLVYRPANERVRLFLGVK